MEEERENHELRDDRPRSPKSHAPEFTMHQLPNRTTRVEYIDSDGKPHDKRQNALKSSMRKALTSFFAYWLGLSNSKMPANVSDIVVELVMEHRTHVINMCTPPRDLRKDQIDALAFANSHGTVPPRELKRPISPRYDGAVDADDEDDDDALRVYDRDDMLQAWNAGLRAGIVPSPIDDHLRKDG